MAAPPRAGYLPRGGEGPAKRDEGVRFEPVGRLFFLFLLRFYFGRAISGLLPALPERRQRGGGPSEARG